MGTLAYLTSSDKVENTFTVGKVAITLDEAKVDEKGQAIQDADRVKTNDYKLIPGIDVDKDPTVTVKAGSEDCYVRVLVTVTKASVMNNTWNSELFTGKGKNWTRKLNDVVDLDADTQTMELRYDGVVPYSETDTVLPAVFTGIHVPGELTNEQMASVAGFKIDVVAQAIQAAGFADADAAWAAFPQK